MATPCCQSRFPVLLPTGINKSANWSVWVYTSRSGPVAETNWEVREGGKWARYRAEWGWQVFRQMEEQGWLPRAGNMQLNPHAGLLLLPNDSSTYFSHPLSASYVPGTLIGSSHSKWQQLPLLHRWGNWGLEKLRTGWDCMVTLAGMNLKGVFKYIFR